MSASAPLVGQFLLNLSKVRFGQLPPGVTTLYLGSDIAAGEQPVVLCRAQILVKAVEGRAVTVDNVGARADYVLVVVPSKYVYLFMKHPSDIAKELLAGAFGPIAADILGAFQRVLGGR